MIEDSNLGGNGMKTNDEALLKIKYNVLRTVSKLAFEGRLEEERDNIPFKLIPGPKAQFRCCVYKEREIIRQRVRLAEGKCPSDKQSDNIIQVISSACEECPITVRNVWVKPARTHVTLVRSRSAATVPISIRVSVKSADAVLSHVRTMRSLS